MPTVQSRQRMQQQKLRTANKQPFGSNNTMKIIIIAAIALIIAFIATYLLSPTFRGFFRTAPEQAAVEQQQEYIEEVFVPEPELPAEELKAEKQESSSSVPKGFYVIVGSFQQKSNADKFVKKCKDIELEVLHFTELGFYRVSAGRYENIHKAYNDKYSIKDLDGCENAWVLENR